MSNCALLFLFVCLLLQEKILKEIVFIKIPGPGEITTLSNDLSILFRSFLALLERQLASGSVQSILP